MCRAIKTLHNFQPPATEAEIRASSVQFVRKLSGFTKPSKANEAAFNTAVEEVSRAARQLLEPLVKRPPPGIEGWRPRKAGPDPGSVFRLRRIDGSTFIPQRYELSRSSYSSS